MIKRAALLLVVIGMLLSAGIAAAQDAGQPLVLTDETGPTSAGKPLDILVDPSGQLTIDQVTSPELAARWTHSHADIPSFGFSQATIWARLRVKNDSTVHAWQLLVDQANLDYVDLYLPSPDNGSYTVKRTGALLPISTRDVLDPNIVLDVPVPEGGEKTLYLRARSNESLTLPLSLWTLRALNQHLAQERLLWGIVYGALATMMVYHFFLFLSLRDRVYLLLVVYIFAQILVSMTSTGWGALYLWPNHPGAKQVVLPLALGLVVVTWIMFAIVFLETKTRTPRLHKVLKMLLVVAVIVVALFPVDRGRVSEVALLVLALPVLVVEMLAGLAAWRQGYHPARYFVIARLAPFVVSLVSILALLGQAPMPPELRLAPNVSMLLLVLLLSFALADRIQVLKANVEQANRSLIAKERRLAEYLEAIPFGVTVYDARRAPAYINRTTAAFLQVEPLPETWPSDPMDALRLTRAGTDEAYPAEDLPLPRALRGETAHADDIVVEANGQRVEVEIWSRPLYDEEGTIEGAITTTLDIGERRRAEAELAAYRDHLEAMVQQRTLEESRQREVAQALQETASALTHSLDQPAVLRAILAQLRLVTDYDGALVALVDDRQLVVVDANGACAAAQAQVAPLAQDQPDVDMLLAAQAHLFSQLPSPPPSSVNGAGQPLGEVTVPLFSEGKAIGVLTIARAGVDTTREEDRALLQAFANQAAIAVTNARLHKQAQEAAAVNERERLARDLHDAVTQTLFSASLIAEAIPIQIERDPAGAADNLDKLRQLTRGALAEMRTLLLELRPAALVEANLDVLIRQLAEAFTGRTRVPVSLTVDGGPGSKLPPDVKITFYRVAQEAFSNIMKHAQASQVDVALRYRPDQATLLMDDNGKGFAPGSPGDADHMGLRIMRERAQSIDAQLDVESRPGGGVSLALRWKG